MYQNQWPGKNKYNKLGGEKTKSVKRGHLMKYGITRWWRGEYEEREKERDDATSEGTKISRGDSAPYANEKCKLVRREWNIMKGKFGHIYGFHYTETLMVCQDAKYTYLKICHYCVSTCHDNLWSINLCSLVFFFLFMYKYFYLYFNIWGRRVTPKMKYKFTV